MKGHCEIILSENGKEVMHTHDDNIVTNALQKIFQVPEKYNLANGSVRGYYADLMPIINKKVIGGVALLSKAIQGTDDELKEKVILPIGKENIVGHAGQNTDLGTGNLALGVYNSSESGKIENGYKFVWDFPSDRANGTIECVCLTSEVAGRALPRAVETAPSASVITKLLGNSTLSNTYLILGINKKEKVVLLSNGGTSAATVDLESSLGLFDIVYPKNYSTSPLQSLSTFKKYDLAEQIDVHNCQFTDRGLCYLRGATLKILDENTFEEKETYTFSNTPPAGKRSWYVKNNYFYYIVYQEKIIKINLLDLTDVTEIEQSTNASIFEGEINNYMILSNSSESYEPTWEYLFDGKNIASTPFDTGATGGLKGHLRAFQTSNKLYFIRLGSTSTSGGDSDTWQMCRYEASAMTIDNLETPVTKTNAQTMKVIYTITEGEEPEEGEGEE